MTTTFKNCFGLVSRITDKAIGARGTINLERFKRDFYSWDPKRAAQARERLSYDLQRSASKSVTECMKHWVKEHQHDPETLCASKVIVTFDRSPGPFGEEELRVTAYMSARTD
ncbi:hypothetical protein SEA_MASELOP_79 [Rhodococcus phage Maselop]|nr:hypothetical protein SEA_BRAXOADDIE_79 [Rhodococcus phage Braxoaddie]WNM65002.1 hypothetical protein SEA_MASELOP_79 [Rhodococcus phage Maselop]WNM67463.1 hypothetical protein SEA_POLYYUKI_79 [Rhodococcus phage Polyyuki]